MVDKNAFLIELSASDRSDFGRRDFVYQNPTQKVFSTVWTLEAEVNNGGFHQYFFNSGGDTANFASTALQQIGALKCAAIVERALRIVSTSPLPVDWEERQTLLDDLGDELLDRLEPLDAEFYAYPDDLTSLLFEFVRKHPEEFGGIDE